jgi:hypothetical protein
MKTLGQNPEVVRPWPPLPGQVEAIEPLAKLLLISTWRPRLRILVRVGRRHHNSPSRTRRAVPMMAVELRHAPVGNASCVLRSTTIRRSIDAEAVHHPVDCALSARSHSGARIAARTARNSGKAAARLSLSVMQIMAVRPLGISTVETSNRIVSAAEPSLGVMVISIPV